MRHGATSFRLQPHNDGYYDFNKSAFIPQTTESTLIYIDRPMHMKVNKKKQQEIQQQMNEFVFDPTPRTTLAICPVCSK